MQRYFFMIVASLVCSSSAMAGQELTMADLQALSKMSSWAEILQKADKVKPTLRTSEWNSVIDGAAIHELELVPAAIKTNEEMIKIRTTILSAEEKYAFLLNSKDYIQTKTRVLENVAKACSDQPSYGCGGYINALSRGVKSYAKGTAKKIALLMANDNDSPPSLSIRYWKEAAQDDQTSCEHGALERAVLGALNSDIKGEMARDGRDVLKGCVASLEKPVMDRLASSEAGSDFAKNACEVVAKREKYTLVKKQKCK